MQQAFGQIFDTVSQAEGKVWVLVNQSSAGSSGDARSSPLPSHRMMGASAVPNFSHPEANHTSLKGKNCTAKERQELDCKENVDPMSFAPKKKKTSSTTTSGPGLVCFNECSGDARSPAEACRIESALDKGTQQQGDSRKRSHIQSVMSRTKKKGDELATKTADLMSFAPKKKSSLTSKSSSCRIGNMIVKRNSWNLSFEPLRLISPEKGATRAADSSVYDFN